MSPLSLFSLPSSLPSLGRCLLCLLVVPLFSAWGASPTFGGLVIPASGTSALGHPVSFRSTLTIAGGTLTIDLENTSPNNTTDAADVLSSFYFDIRSGTARPTLSYVSGTGFVYLVRSGTTDLEVYYNPLASPPTQFVSGTASNLKAVNIYDGTWQFLPMQSGSNPFLGFGIGTVGNSGLSPNGFTPSIVGPSGNAMINFAIYRGGDIEPNGVLNYKYLVKNKATFTFTGVNGYTEDDIVDDFVFGLGTAPDSTITVSLPEPPYAACLAALGACGWLLARVRTPLPPLSLTGDRRAEP
ncbi:MAG: XDD4 family exosortase-dependent surface protein [Pirellulales bacterium]